jgi:hypothetical protein
VDASFGPALLRAAGYVLAVVSALAGSGSLLAFWWASR